MRKLTQVKTVNLELDPETHGAAKAKAALEGIGFYRWCVRAIRRAAGLSDEITQPDSKEKNS